MSKFKPKDLILSNTIGCQEQSANSFSKAYNEYRNSILTKQQAINRVRVLTRQLQKSRSHIKSKRRHKDELEYIHERAQLDSYIVQMNKHEGDHILEKLHNHNFKIKARQLKNIQLAKSQMQNTKSSLYKSTERQSIQNQRYLFLSNQKAQTEREMHVIRERLREKKRSYKLIDQQYHKIKIARQLKNKQISFLMTQQKFHNEELSSIIDKNAQLKLRKERSIQQIQMLENYLEINPQKLSKFRYIKERIHS